MNSRTTHNGLEKRTSFGRRLAFVLGFAVLGLAAVAGMYGLHAAAAGRAVRSRDFDRARQHLEVCLKIRPRNAALRLEAARLARRVGDFEAADRNLARIDASAARSPAVDFERRLLRAQRGELEDVERDLQARLGGVQTDELAIREALAGGFLASGRLLEAKNQLDAILRQDPKHLQALLMRAKLFASVPREEEESLRDLRRAVDAAPASSAAHLALAQALLHRGFEREAVAHFEWVRSRQPDRPEVLLGLAECRLDAGDRDAAARLLDHLLARHPDHPAGLIERGRSMLFAGQPARAEELCRRALGVAPRDASAWQVMALALRAEGRTEDAARALDEHCRIEGATARLQDLSGQLQDSPNDPDLRVRIAATYLSLDLPAEAERSLQIALAIDPNHATARELLRNLRRLRSGQAARP